MPEGDTIHRTAHRLRQVLLGAAIVEATDNGRFVESAQLIGARFSSVEARGKHLLMHLHDQRVVHSHMGMTGKWRVMFSAKSQLAEQPAALVMRLRSDEQTCPVIVCSHPKTLELLSVTNFRRHPFLHRLGPDLMHGEPDPSMVLPRFRVHDATPLGEAIMNQTIVSGIGNVYKSEVLFLVELDPFASVSRFSDEQLMSVVAKAVALMSRNRQGRRRTRFRPGPRHWVYGRVGEPCFRCGTPIQLRRQGELGRSTYWCSSCQPS